MLTFAQLDEETGELTLRIQCNVKNPGLSKQGKTRLVASVTQSLAHIVVNDSPLKVSLNATIPAHTTAGQSLIDNAIATVDAGHKKAIEMVANGNMSRTGEDLTARIAKT